MVKHKSDINKYYKEKDKLDKLIKDTKNLSNKDRHAINLGYSEGLLPKTYYSDGNSEVYVAENKGKFYVSKVVHNFTNKSRKGVSFSNATMPILSADKFLEHTKYMAARFNIIR